jgi:hypothetical protein
VGELGAPASRGEHGDNLGGFLKCGYPKMENPKQKWTIWGYPHFRTPPFWYSAVFFFQKNLTSEATSGCEVVNLPSPKTHASPSMAVDWKGQLIYGVVHVIKAS